MKIRTKIFPKTINDACVTLFLFLIIPLIYFFELWIVLPKFYQQWSFLYWFHFIIGNFIMFNVCSNLMAIILCDTSLKGIILPAEGGKNWRLCAVCETLAPPRSWHCQTCNTCILKRDHHCMFTGCCVGHYNHRYFMVFVFYIFLATVYASYYNYHFIRPVLSLDSWISILKILFPLATLFLEWTKNQLYIFFILIVLLGGFFSGGILYFHVSLMLKGMITPERKDTLGIYDNGILDNAKVIFGTRWYLVWISPFLQSQLPCDGVKWETKHSTKAK